MTITVPMTIAAPLYLTYTFKGKDTADDDLHISNPNQVCKDITDPQSIIIIINIKYKHQQIPKSPLKTVRLAERGLMRACPLP